MHRFTGICAVRVFRLLGWPAREARNPSRIPTYLLLFRGTRPDMGVNPATLRDDPGLKETFDVSGAVDDPENLDAVGEGAVEDELALEALYGPGAQRRKAGIPKTPRRTQFRHVRQGLKTNVASVKKNGAPHPRWRFLPEIRNDRSDPLCPTRLITRAIGSGGLAGPEPL